MRVFSSIAENSCVLAGCEALHEEIAGHLVGDDEIDESVAHIAFGDEHFSRGTFRTASTPRVSGVGPAGRASARPGGWRAARHFCPTNISRFMQKKYSPSDVRDRMSAAHVSATSTDTPCWIAASRAIPTKPTPNESGS